MSVFAERLHSSGPNFLGFFSALLAFFMMVILVVLPGQSIWLVFRL